MYMTSPKAATISTITTAIIFVNTLAAFRLAPSSTLFFIKLPSFFANANTFLISRHTLQRRTTKRVDIFTQPTTPAHLTLYHQPFKIFAVTTLTHYSETHLK